MKDKLFSSAVIILIIAILSNVIGLFKEIYVAYEFGTNIDIEVFYLGLSIPIFLATLFSAALNATIIPSYLKTKTNSDTTVFFFNTLKLVIIFLSIFSLISSLIIIFVQPYIIGLPDNENKLVIRAGLLLSPIIIIHGLSAFLSGILNAEKKVIANNIIATLIPLGTIITLVLFNKKSYLLLCIGLYLGYLARIVIQIILLSNVINLKAFNLSKFQIIEYRQSIEEFLWIVFSSSILGLLPVIANYYASYLDPGSVASLNYSKKLISVGLVAVGIVINSVFFPYIASSIIKDKYEGINYGLKIAGYSLILFSIMIIPIYILSEDIVKLIFERGEFGPDSTQNVALVLKYMLFYIPFYVVGTLLSRLVVSLGISKVFVLGNILSLLVFLGSGWLLIYKLNYGIEGIGIIYTLVYLTSSLYLLFHILNGKKSHAH